MCLEPKGSIKENYAHNALLRVPGAARDGAPQTWTVISTSYRQSSRSGAFEDAGDLRIAADAGMAEWRGAVPIRKVDVGAGLHQRLDGRSMVAPPFPSTTASIKAVQPSVLT